MTSPLVGSADSSASRRFRMRVFKFPLLERSDDDTSLFWRVFSKFLTSNALLSARKPRTRRRTLGDIFIGGVTGDCRQETAFGVFITYGFTLSVTRDSFSWTWTETRILSFKVQIFFEKSPKSSFGKWQMPKFLKLQLFQSRFHIICSQDTLQRVLYFPQKK